MIKAAIYGYGNLGRGVEAALAYAEDMELVGIFTRREPSALMPLHSETRVYSVDELKGMKNDIDVVIICGGSATDLPAMTPDIAESFTCVDSFDTHANIPSHFFTVDSAAKKGGNIAVISVGWDPGMFSVNRLYANCILPCGRDYTFWGRGVSQGHSDAIRRIEGVLDARQYTVPVPSALEQVRAGLCPELSTREKHTRECFVVAEEGADKARIEREIKEMPNYFSDYDTSVTFISMEELREKHMGIPHGGVVIRNGSTADNSNTHTIEYSLRLDSNPEFTGSVMVAYARAAYKLALRGEAGCRTVFDIAPGDLSVLSPEELRAKFL